MSLTGLEHRFLASTGIRVGIMCAVALSMRVLLLPQIRALIQAGYAVCGICSDGPEVPLLRAAGLPIFPLQILRRVSPVHDLMSLLGVVHLLRRLRLDILHTHTPKAQVLGQVGGFIARVPIRINTVHGFYFVNEVNPLRKWLFKQLAILSCRLSNFVLSQSQEDLDMVLRGKWVTPEKLQWLGNGVNVERFRRDNFPVDEGQRVRAELGIPQDAYVVGIVARMTREKGFPELFEAMARLRKTVPNAHLVHVGPVDASHGDGVRPEMAAQLGSQDVCHFLGYRDDVPRLMTAMDVFCLPSHREGFPRSVVEASAMSVPSVVTDIRGNREAVRHGQSGLMVPLGDVPGIVNALRQLHDDAALHQRLGAAARCHAEEEMDERRVFQIILSLYERQLNRHGRKAPQPLAALAQSPERTIEML
jgi:glycosyltransferase involved in cell wall biosynthesis